MRLGSEEKEVLRALVSGYQLKSHRYLDGQKIYTLHDTASDATQFAWEGDKVIGEIIPCLRTFS